MVEMTAIISDCCIMPIEFYDIKRNNTQTIGLYICPKCYGVYER